MALCLVGCPILASPIVRLKGEENGNNIERRLNERFAFVAGLAIFGLLENQ